jgi:hypothetical protein
VVSKFCCHKIYFLKRHSLAKPFIAVRKTKGIEYASICTPARINGKKVNNPIYLGRVIDLKEGRFRNKEKGEFIYTLEDGYSFPQKFAETQIEASILKGSLSFGHVYCVHELLERTGLLKLFREIENSSPDTLLALMMHRLLETYADSHANSFFEQTYTRLLYPTANLSSQGISRYLTKIGTEAIRRDFLRMYIDIMLQTKDSGILIDSTGLPNNVDLPITAISNHGSGPINEIRLIYVIDKDTYTPIYYRAIPGNVVDIVTMKGTVAELKTLNVNIKYAVLDAGYNSESNLEALFSLGIDFMTRLISNRGLYKDLLAKNCDSVMSAPNRLVYNSRVIFMTMNEVTVANNHKAYAYIGVDLHKKYDGIKKISLREDPKHPLSDEEYDKLTKTAGMFVMISSMKMETKDVLPYYYSRQTIEQIFDVSKNYARIIPIGVHNISTFNGHLLISFITTIVYLKFQRLFHKTKYNPLDFITELRGINCIVYEDHLQIFEPTSKQKEILKILEMEMPTRLPLRI